MRLSWWKILGVLLVSYSIVAGLLFDVPRKDILNETIRNLYYHVPMWFTMVIILAIGAFHSIKYLRSNNPISDIKAVSYTEVGIFFSVLGMVTGMIWAKYTWGEPWSNDPKQLGTAICMLTYFAYMILRGGIKDEDKRGRISAVYNIFAFALMIPLLYILPRMVDSLHPGNGGNPGFNAYDLDQSMRGIFYPAVIGWILMSLWIAELFIRYRSLEYQQDLKSLQSHNNES